MAEVANVSSTAVVAGDREMVTCKVHNAVRQAKFMTAIPVFNADREVIKFTYVCQPGCECKSRAERGGLSMMTMMMPGMMNPEVSATAYGGDVWSGGGTAGGGGRTGMSTSQQQPSRITPEALDLLERSGGTAAGGGGGPQKPNGSPPPSVSVARSGPARYYEIGAQAATTGPRAGPKKVCWCCGMDDHEKYQCWNQLCKRCHGLQYDSNDLPHKCSQVPLSPFVLVAPLLDTELKYARCVVCHQYGHLDCRSTTSLLTSSSSSTTTFKSGASLTCCYCGECGHHAFDCPQQSYPDRWVQGVERLGREVGYTAPAPLPPTGAHQQVPPHTAVPGSARNNASLCSSDPATTTAMGMSQYSPYYGGSANSSMTPNATPSPFGGSFNQRHVRPPRGAGQYGDAAVVGGGGDAFRNQYQQQLYRQPHGSQGDSGLLNRRFSSSSGDNSSGLHGGRSRQQEGLLQRVTSSAVDGKNPARGDYRVRDRVSFGHVVSSAAQAQNARPIRQQQQQQPTSTGGSGTGGGNRSATAAAPSAATSSGVPRSVQTPPPAPPQQQQQPKVAPSRASRRRRPRDDDSGSEPDFHF